MVAEAAPTPHRPIPWATYSMALLGFLLAVGVVGLMASRQYAMYHAQTYLQNRYNINLELPVEEVSPTFLTGPTRTGRPLPPLGFCWSVELALGSAGAEVMINPWTHEIVDWEADDLKLGLGKKPSD